MRDPFSGTCASDNTAREIHSERVGVLATVNKNTADRGATECSGNVPAVVNAPDSDNSPAPFFICEDKLRNKSGCDFQFMSENCLGWMKVVNVAEC